MIAMNRFLKTLNENRLSIAMFVATDIILALMITASVQVTLWALSITAYTSFFYAFTGIATAMVTLNCIYAVAKHKRAYFGKIELREDMEPRLFAQLHEILMRLTSMLAVGAIVLLGVIWGLLHGLAQYLLTIVR